MSATSSPLIPHEAARVALARVYRLLLELADGEAAGNQDPPQEPMPAARSGAESTPSQQGA
jgi:hypothetical protein